MNEIHPEKALIGLLLPGAVFCCLAFIDWWRTGRKPSMIVYGWCVPIPLIYCVMLFGGWLFLILMLSDRIKRRTPVSRYTKLQDELYGLKRGQAPVDQTLSMLVGMEAAIFVLNKHNLLLEWGAEVDRLKSTVKPAIKPLTDWQQDQAETTRILRKRVGDEPS